ncbi:hypothetical protein K470DRAFT_116268 [Piedraia hortae CBS 480.64]|uniref:Uncharacterized protein n=1 Tax=Piedraia hortae CBS 480.64 TaxID=1314780 RepID=A0A6A7BUI4_9PEZI|nr:hypothetical protein K470DRAFT_116268 [Piedraia hortae CBS 480.64]
MEKLTETLPESSKQNGRAETSNNIVCTLARKLLHAGFTTKFRLEAIDYALYRTLSSSLNDKSPYQVLELREIAKSPIVTGAAVAATLSHTSALSLSRTGPFHVPLFLVLISTRIMNGSYTDTPLDDLHLSTSRTSTKGMAWTLDQALYGFRRTRAL